MEGTVLVLYVADRHVPTGTLAVLVQRLGTVWASPSTWYSSGAVTMSAPEYRHVPTGTRAVLAQRLGTVWASPSTRYYLVRQFGWRRPRLRVHPAKPKVGLRPTRADERWHIDPPLSACATGPAPTCPR